ncbi:hypothetical protein D3C76_1539100 [compost metagenome]
MLQGLLGLFAGLQGQRQQQAQLQRTAVLFACQGLIHGLQQLIRVSTALGDVQALTGNVRGIDIVGGQQHPRAVPVVELLGRAHRMIGGVQAFFQGCNPRPFQPS